MNVELPAFTQAILASRDIWTAYQEPIVIAGLAHIVLGWAPRAAGLRWALAALPGTACALAIGEPGGLLISAFIVPFAAASVFGARYQGCFGVSTCSRGLVEVLVLGLQISALAGLSANVDSIFMIR